jgi:hypothetical protein
MCGAPFALVYPCFGISGTFGLTIGTHRPAEAMSSRANELSRHAYRSIHSFDVPGLGIPAHSRELEGFLSTTGHQRLF